MDALQADLTSTDTDAVSRAAGTILMYGDNSTFFLCPPSPERCNNNLMEPERVPAKTQLETTLAWIAREIGSGRCPGFRCWLYCIIKNSGLGEESRVEVVSDLAEFKQEGANRRNSVAY